MGTWICKLTPLKGWYLIYDDHNIRKCLKNWTLRKDPPPNDKGEEVEEGEGGNEDEEDDGDDEEDQIYLAIKNIFL